MPNPESTRAGVSAKAQRVLATAPPGGIPGPISPLTAPLFREIVDRRNRPAQDAADRSFMGQVMTTTVAGVPTTRLTPAGSATADDAPMIVYVHGGAFMFGHPVDPLILKLASATCLTVHSIKYDLVPEARFPAAINQAVAVWDALTAHRRGPVILAGCSAGGNLALVLIQHLLAEKNAERNTVKLPDGVVLVSPWADLTPPDQSRLRNEGIDPLIRWRGMLDKTAAAYANGNPLTDPGISPLSARYVGLAAPTLITTGSLDLFEPDCIRLAKALERDGVPVTLDYAEGLWHVYQAHPDLPETSESIERIAEFIAETTGKPQRL